MKYHDGRYSVGSTTGGESVYLGYGAGGDSPSNDGTNHGGTAMRG